MRKTVINKKTDDVFTLTHDQVKARYNIGSYTVEKIAKEAGAVIKVGKRKLYIVNKIDEYLEKSSIA